ncbi:MFS transporter [Sphingosinicella sp. CPCC 101087]|uniref:MFS transporter n=1 Tax=Sphingosinicella sp. CPCC 101087 TaxID=2497754 RepID=UPI00101B7FBB|nr:MFS transporter [Sphingosinicella sp. CPCC 101087]
MPDEVTLQRRAGAIAGREPLGTPFYRLCFCVFGVMGCFYLPLSAAPLHAAGQGGNFGAGLVTGVLMGGTVLGEIVATRLIARLGRRLTAALAMLALALPGFAVFGGDLVLVAAACLVRGVGLGIVLVVAGGLAATLAPLARRNEALGIYGLSAALPAILFVPLGLWMMAQGSASLVAGATMAFGLAGLLGLSVFPPRAEPGGNTVGRVDWAAQVWPATTLAAGAVTAGVVITFLPLVVGHSETLLVEGALLLHGLAAALSRLAAGRHGDRRGPMGPVLFGLVATVTGAVLLGISSGNLAVLVAITALGAGFGLLQSGSLTLMLNRAPKGQEDAISAAWNIAYDTGLGFGAVGFGLLANPFGYGGAFLLLAGLILPLVAPFARASARRPVRLQRHAG